MKQTNWCVITGAPSSGKTTLINALSIKGYRTEPEIARAYILYLMAKGQGIRGQSRSELGLQQNILQLKLKREARLHKDRLVFFDRGLPDSLAYYRYYGLHTSEIMDAMSVNRYKHVFYLEGLPIVYDGVRNESAEQAQMIGEQIVNAYSELGYKLITLPPKSVNLRLETILSTIK